MSEAVGWNVFVNRRPALLPGWRSMRCASCGKRWNVHDVVRGRPLPCTCGANVPPLSLGQALALSLARACPQCTANPFDHCARHDA